MIVVTGGTFPMGTDKVDRTNHALSLGLEKPWFADESPEHRVTVKTFYLDRLEVTNKDYYIFIHATNHKPPPHWNGLKFPNGQGNFPVTNLTFFEAASFAEWAGKRLPTEIEWERASRGPNNWIYPWGNKFQFTMANISQSNKKTKDLSLKPVGSYPQGASAFGIEDMIDRLPQGLDTPCHERGASLSSGERQLLALARAFLSRPRVLILDEATSNVDQQSESKIEHALDNLLEGRTAIIIAHRLATAMRADIIAVVKDQGIIELGTHAELIEKNGYYAGMYETWISQNEGTVLV